MYSIPSADVYVEHWYEGDLNNNLVVLTAFAIVVIIFLCFALIKILTGVPCCCLDKKLGRTKRKKRRYTTTSEEEEEEEDKGKEEDEELIV